MGLLLKQANGNYEEVSSARHYNVPVEVEYTGAGGGDSRRFIIAGSQILSETIATFAGWPIQSLLRTVASRSVNDGVTTNASRTVTSATANFTSADLGCVLFTTNIGGGLGTRIVKINSTTSVDVSGAATASGTAQAFSIGSNRIITTMLDTGPGGASIAGHRWIASKEHSSQTANLFEAQDELGNILWAISPAGLTVGASGISPGVVTATSAATYTINLDVTRQYEVTNMATNATSVTWTSTGTPARGTKLEVAFQTTGADYLITWDSAKFESSGITLPTSTSLGGADHRLDVGFKYNPATGKMRHIGYS